MVEYMISYQNISNKKILFEMTLYKINKKNIQKIQQQPTPPNNPCSEFHGSKAFYYKPRVSRNKGAANRNTSSGIIL